MNKTSISTGSMPIPTMVASYKDAHQDARLHRYMLHIMGNKLVPAHIAIQNMSVVLDIGCGAGDWLIDMARLYPGVQMYGLDINHETLKLARERCIHSHLVNIQWRQINSLQDAPLLNGYVDLIHLRRCHYWITPQRWYTFFTSCQRILKPGGWISAIDIEMVELSSPAFMTLRHALLHTLQQLNHCMDTTANSYGVLPRLPHMLHEASFTQVGYELYAIDLGFMSGQSGQSFLSLVLDNFYSVRTAIIQYGELTEEAFDKLVSQIRIDLQDPYLCGWGFLISAYGKRREREPGA